MQQRFVLSDPAMEEALHEIPAMRAFAQLNIGNELIPDVSSILRVRHRLAQHQLADRLFAKVNALLEVKGLLLRAGTNFEATLIAAPSSTKNKSGSPDPEIHQAKKGNTWHFGMQAHIGVDGDSGLTTAANVNDVTQAHALLHGKEKRTFAHAGYPEAGKRPENRRRTCIWYVAMRLGKLRALADDELGLIARALEKGRAGHPGEGRTPVSDHQAPVRVSENPLSRLGEEHRTDRHAALPDESLPSATSIVGDCRRGASEVGPKGTSDPFCGLLRWGIPLL